MPQITEPVMQAGPQESIGSSDDEWLCAWCLNPVAKERDRFRFDGQTEFTFSNPQGIRFHLITFSPAPGCRQTGSPTFEDTWFAEHAWSFCQCARCGIHLGWYYSGPHNFAGLIRDRLVQGCVRN